MDQSVKENHSCGRKDWECPPACVGPKNCIWNHCYYVKRYQEKLGMLPYEYTFKSASIKMDLVLCHCGYPPIVKYDKGDVNGIWSREHWIAKCSNPYCMKTDTAKTELEVCKKWNIKYDWYVHELSSVFSEEEYTKMVEDCGGHIEPTPHWEEKKHEPCKHCELRERIKESVIRKLKDENLCSSKLSAES